MKAKGWAATAVGAATLLVAAPAALADGTETLGPPSVAIAAGTNVLVAGAGMQQYPNAPNAFSFTVPTGATVKQVLLYWEGHATLSNPACPGAFDDTISVNGTSVTGTLIGGPTHFFGLEHFAAYRSDITALGLVSAGANTLTISDMHFVACFPAPSGPGNDGAGVIVIYDTGGPAATIAVRDGSDLAFTHFAPPLDTTVPQTFTFPAAAEARTATLGTLVSSVRGPDRDELRPNQLSITFGLGGVGDVLLDNPWQSNQGPEFDATNLSVTVPAGATQMTVQALSAGPGGLPASFGWNAVALSIPTLQQQPPPPPVGAQGCTPGYWKQPHHFFAWTSPYTPGTALSAVFSPSGLGSLGSKTLLEALSFKGGPTLTHKKQNLLRIGVASLLNAASPAVSFGMTPAEVIAAIDAALASGSAAALEALQDELDAANNRGCPLGNGR